MLPCVRRRWPAPGRRRRRPGKTAFVPDIAHPPLTGGLCHIWRSQSPLATGQDSEFRRVVRDENAPRGGPANYDPGDSRVIAKVIDAADTKVFGNAGAVSFYAPATESRNKEDSVPKTAVSPRRRFTMSTFHHSTAWGHTLSYPQYPQPQQAQPWQGGEPPLWAPYYGASLGAAVNRFFKKYTVFHGRASRSEYWWWALVAFGVSIILQILIASGNGGAISGTVTSAPGPGLVIGGILAAIWGLGTVIPSLALVARRLHDVNLSGWLMLVALVPFLGGVALLVMTILPSSPAGQRFDQPGSI